MIWVPLSSWERYLILYADLEVVGYSEFDRRGIPKWVELRCPAARQTHSEDGK